MTKVSVNPPGGRNPPQNSVYVYICTFNLRHSFCLVINFLRQPFCHVMATPAWTQNFPQVPSASARGLADYLMPKGKRVLVLFHHHCLTGLWWIELFWSIQCRIGARGIIARSRLVAKIKNLSNHPQLWGDHRHRSGVWVKSCYTSHYPTSWTTFTTKLISPPWHQHIETIAIDFSATIASMQRRCYYRQLHHVPSRSPQRTGLRHPSHHDRLLSSNDTVSKTIFLNPTIIARVLIHRNLVSSNLRMPFLFYLSAYPSNGYVHLLSFRHR